MAVTVTVAAVSGRTAGTAVLAVTLRMMIAIASLAAVRSSSDGCRYADRLYRSSNSSRTQVTYAVRQAAASLVVNVVASPAAAEIAEAVSLVEEVDAEPLQATSLSETNVNAARTDDPRIRNLQETSRLCVDTPRAGARPRAIDHGSEKNFLPSLRFADP